MSSRWCLPCAGQHAIMLRHCFTGSVAFLEGISRFVDALIRIDEDAVEPSGAEVGLFGNEGESDNANNNTTAPRGRDQIAWREFKTLAAAAELRTHVAGPVVATEGAEADGTVDASATILAGRGASREGDPEPSEN